VIGGDQVDSLNPDLIFSTDNQNSGLAARCAGGGVAGVVDKADIFRRRRIHIRVEVALIALAP
jgi:hypothetical protein